MRNKLRCLAACVLYFALLLVLAPLGHAAGGTLSVYDGDGLIRVVLSGEPAEGTILDAAFLGPDDLPVGFDGFGEPVLVFRAMVDGFTTGSVSMVPPDKSTSVEKGTLWVLSDGIWTRVPFEPVVSGMPGGAVRTGVRADNVPLGYFVWTGGGVMGASEEYDRNDPTRYLNQNFWTQNRDVTVWWAGFSDYRSEVGGTPEQPTEHNFLIPAEGDNHIESVTMTRFRDGVREGTPYVIPEGDGTDGASGTAPRLYDLYPGAAGDLDNGSLPAMYDYIPCGEDEATCLTASWKINGMEVLASGLAPKGTHNWDAARAGSGFLWTRTGTGITTAWIPDFIRPEFSYYKTVLPSQPKTGHAFALLEIIPEPGYYVKDCVITCGFHGNAYENCSVYSTGNAFQKGFGAGGGGAGVSLLIDSENFCHGNNQDGTLKRYYIMVRTEPVPGYLYVDYVPGSVSDKIAVPEEWLRKTRETASGKIEKFGPAADEIGPGEPWTTEDLSYTTDTVSEETLSLAREAGYEFLGWSLTYYPEAEKAGSDVSFSGEAQSPFEIAAGGKVSLRTHARLTAQWSDTPVQAEVRKKTVGIGNPEDREDRAFLFHLCDAEGNLVPFVKRQLTEKLMDGVLTTEYADEECNGDFEIVVAGEGISEPVFILGLAPGEYRIVETNWDGATASYENGSFTVVEGMNPVRVLVINNFSTEIPDIPESGESLPETGGRGTAGIYRAGIAGLVLALAFFTGPRRSKKKVR